MRRLPLASLIALALLSGTVEAAPWTYRGSLSDGGKPANGRYDIRLTLLDGAGRRSVLAPVTFVGVEVKGGSFAVDVDFGVDLSNAPAMKLMTEVGENGANFVALGEPSTFDPKATLAGVCWDTQGNAGTNAATDFLGTTDTQALNFRVNNARGLILDSKSNHVGGAAVNAFNASGNGQTIAGGGSASPTCGIGGDLDCRNETASSYSTVGGGTGNNASGSNSTIGGGSVNRATENSATVAGGFDNTASGSNAAIVGGFLNRASGQSSIVAGGYNNKASATYASVAGGQSNTASNQESSVAGGNGNSAAGRAAAAAGGRTNCAGGDYSFAAGSFAQVRVGTEANDGLCAANSGDADGDEGAFVWADASSNNGFPSTGPNQFAVRATGGLRWSGTGLNSTTSPAVVHQVNTASNTCDGGSAVANSRTAIDHPLLNGNPNAVIVVTPNFGLRSNGVSPPLDKLYGLYYSDVANGNCPTGKWVIYQLASSPSALPNSMRLNLWFVLP